MIIIILLIIYKLFFKKGFLGPIYLFSRRQQPIRSSTKKRTENSLLFYCLFVDLYRTDIARKVHGTGDRTAFCPEQIRNGFVGSF
jgi:hypothetical protein